MGGAVKLDFRKTRKVNSPNNLVFFVRLLKNSIHSGRYLLFTESLLNEMDGTNEKKSFDFQLEGHQLCERYESLRHICFTYFEYSEVREELVA